MLIGHQKQWGLLEKMAQSNRAPHALIFSGEEGLGKKEIVLDFFQFFSNGDFKNHPDLMVIESPKKEIVIDQIRDLQKFLSYTKQIAKYKFVIINQAERLNIEAQNCLLKTLEEPSVDSILILVTSLPQQLAKTILSRCQEIKFYPLSFDIMEKALSDYKDRANFQEVLAMAGGRPRHALELFNNEQILKKQINNLQIANELAKSDLVMRFLLIKDYFSKSEKEEAFEEISQFLQDSIFYWRFFLQKKLGIAKPFANLYTKAILENYPISRIATILEKIEELQFLFLTSNINKRLLLENLILNL